jgi:hypothetical protein
MIRTLEEINKIFTDVQPYVEFLEMDLNDLKQRPYFNQWKQLHQKHYDSFRQADDRLISMLSTLTPKRIVRGYIGGCRIFQRRVGGFMAKYFDPLYIQTMKKEVINEHIYTSTLFLQVLANHLGEEIKELAIRSLSGTNSDLRLKALSICNQLQIADARQEIEAMISDDNLEIAYLAKEVLQRLPHAE